MGDSDSKKIKFKIRAKSENSSKKELDFLKWATLIISLVAAGSWMTGSSFLAGYWNVAGWNGPITPLSFQQVAYFGFMGPLQNWFYGLLILLGFAVYMILLSIRLNRDSRPPPNWLFTSVTWIVKNFRLDASTAKPAAMAVAGIFSFTFFIFIPVVMWFYAAHIVGEKQFRDEICMARTKKIFPTSLKLFDGTTITGEFLERSEKVSVLLNNQAIYVATVGEKPQLLDTTSTLETKCNK
ncbi:hypothetical protein ACO0LG_04650 [Undibacterium sp. Ji42W]|uniref:hypothetical protein n=1 Tax=Undibacterium sp. Ji42W TaxID=3413039 RepID=UPI003BF1DA13